MNVSITDFDLTLVGLSFLFSVLGSAMALIVISIAARKRGKGRIVWTLVSGVMLGGVAVWAMHFIGMLAYQPGMEITYDSGLTLVSAVPAIVLTAIGIWMVIADFTVARLLVGGLVVAAGVVVMHYTGMAAMSMGMEVIYSTPIVALSVVIAVVAATAALLIAVKARGTLRYVSPLVMGVAVCGMHYTGMAAMRMGAHIPDFEFIPGGLSQMDITAAVTSGAFALLIAGAVAAGVELISSDRVGVTA